ncbi:hypothetical protein E1B28_009804 [Marasmius oreades]|uniref:Uncharacterized protein n=1 Tax=Marasmius oreades TaxID=181124 RepID=A0A9P7UR46_9AGAR|nr:uncharacterized protein E1B28_009804 [Marasmius oreades]KAG7090710.1 hypothetical protein E1B28_009804 [Marasmius oreades]
MDRSTLRQRAPTSRRTRLEASYPYPPRHHLRPTNQRQELADAVRHIPNDDNDEDQRVIEILLGLLILHVMEDILISCDTYCV